MPTFGFRRTLFCSLLILLVPTYVSAQNRDPALSTVQNTYFEIVGAHARSVSYVNDLSAHIVEHSLNYLDDREAIFPQRVLVVLRPEASADFQGPYRIQVEPRGFVRLDFQWDEGLSLADTCKALSEAFLTRYSLYHYGPQAPQLMRSWAVRGVGLEAYLKLRPAQILTVVNHAEHSQAFAIDTLISQTFASTSTASFDQESYCLLWALRHSGMNRTTLRQIFEASLAGANISEALERVVLATEPSATPSSLQNWWEHGRRAMVEANYERYETMETSYVWLQQMANFDAYRETGGELENLRALWQHRDEAALLRMLQARRDLISLRLGQVNPVYFNAARSLGALYETVLSDEPAHVFIHAFAAYLSDFEDAQLLRKTVQRALEQ